MEKSKQEKMEVARWMLAQLEARGSLDQSRAANRIKDKFGEDFVKRTISGGYTIDSSVRSLFNDIGKGQIEWEGDSKRWVSKIKPN